MRAPCRTFWRKPLQCVPARGVSERCQSIWPNAAYEDGKGINTLVGADSIAPYGGAAVHDNRVWVQRA